MAKKHEVADTPIDETICPKCGRRCADDAEVAEHVKVHG